MRKRLDYTGEVRVCETPTCDEVFPLLRKGGNQRRFCSDACRERWRSFNRYPRRKEPLNLVCEYRDCEAHFTHWRIGQVPRYCSSSCQVAARDDRRREIKAECVEYLGGECVSCGYDRCHAAMHFHHVDPATKTRKISDFARIARNSWEERKTELDKCILLCANCHAEEHAGLIRVSMNGDVA